MLNTISRAYTEATLAELKEEIQRARSEAAAAQAEARHAHAALQATQQQVASAEMQARMDGERLSELTRANAELLDACKLLQRGPHNDGAQSSPAMHGHAGNAYAAQSGCNERCIPSVQAMGNQAITHDTARVQQYSDVALGNSSMLPHGWTRQQTDDPLAARCVAIPSAATRRASAGADRLAPSAPWPCTPSQTMSNLRASAYVCNQQVVGALAWLLNPRMAISAFVRRHGHPSNGIGALKSSPTAKAYEGMPQAPGHCVIHHDNDLHANNTHSGQSAPLPGAAGTTMRPRSALRPVEMSLKCAAVHTPRCWVIRSS